MEPWDFPGGPVTRTPCFHYKGHVPSLVRELRAHMPLSVAKEKKKEPYKVLYYHRCESYKN